MNAGTKGRVLVVDDDRRMCELLATGLGRKGFAVVTEQSAEDAFDLVGRSELDVVVTDLNMRGLNGIQLCERVVASFPDVPVIVITGSDKVDLKEAVLKAGAFACLTKDLRQAHLKTLPDLLVKAHKKSL